jgi:LacI family transcriptional regulator
MTGRTRRTPHVAILIESSRSFGRGMLEGVARYVRQHGPWSLYYQPRSLDDPLPEWLGTWKGDGILARVETRQMARVVLATGLPAVDLRGRLPDLGLPFVGVDYFAVTRLAFEHLAERGFRHFAFCRSAADRHPHTDQCQAYSRRHVEAAGLTYYCNHPEGGRRRRPAWDEEQAQFADWVLGLPKPVGVMTCADETGYQVIDACRRARVLVPDEVALVSTNNDTILCSLTDPPMTSIDINPQQIGYDGMALLDRLMRGPHRAARPVKALVQPRGVVVRQSSDVLAIADRGVAAALRFIRDRACDGVSVKEVQRHVGLSRTVLDLRFKKALGRTPKDEILRVQIAYARQFLVESNLSLEAIAARSGFSSANYLGDAFTRVLGVRPGEYRKRFQKLG